MKKLTSITAVTAVILATSISAYADEVSVNRLSVHSGSTWGSNDIDADFLGLSGIVAFDDDSYVLELSHSDVDFDLAGLDSSLSNIKIGYGDHTSFGYTYGYLGMAYAEASIDGFSDSAKAYQLGLAWIGHVSDNLEMMVDLGLIKPESLSGYAGFSVDLNYYLTDEFALGVYGSVDGEGENQYGFSATYNF